MNEEWKNETSEKKIERLELVKDMLESEVKMLKEEINQEKEKNKKLEEVIDMMAEEILNLDIKMSKDRYDNAKVWDTKEGIKEYFLKKAKGEKIE